MLLTAYSLPYTAHVCIFLIFLILFPELLIYPEIPGYVYFLSFVICLIRWQSGHSHVNCLFCTLANHAGFHMLLFYCLRSLLFMLANQLMIHMLLFYCYSASTFLLLMSLPRRPVQPRSFLYSGNMLRRRGW